MARLDRLGPAAREVAQVGAVIGREFSSRAAGRGGGPRRGRAGRGARPARRRRAGRSGAARRPTAGYLFKHALVRDAAYGTLLRDRRRRLHAPDRARAGGAVARAGRDGAGADRAPPDRGRRGRSGPCGYWLKAGRRSAERSADREAVRQLRRGLDALATLPPSAERDRLELDFQLALGPRLVSTSGYTSPDAAAAYERASAALREPRRRRPADPGALRPVRATMWCAASAGPRWASPSACAPRRNAGAIPSSGYSATAPSGRRCMQLGPLREARSRARGGRGAPRSAPRPRPGRPVHHRSARLGPRATWRSCSGCWASRTRLARAAREAIRYADELGHASTTSHVRLHAGAQLAALLGDGRAAEAHADAVDRAGEPSTASRPGGDAAPSCAAGRSPATGARQEGLALARRGHGARRALGMMWHGPRYLVLLAEIHARLGDLAEALRLVERGARAGASAPGSALGGRRAPGRGRAAAARGRARPRGRGVLRRRPGRGPAAGGQVLRAARRHEPRPALARPGSAGSEARDLLAPVYGWFTEGFDTPDLRDAKMLLDAL